MPPFPERESSILAKLKKKKPTVTEQAENKEPKQPMPQAQMSNNVNTHNTPPPVSVTQQIVRHHYKTGNCKNVYTRNTPPPVSVTQQVLHHCSRTGKCKNVNTCNTPPPVSVTQQVVQHHCSSCFSFIAAIPTTLYKQLTFV